MSTAAQNRRTRSRGRALHFAATALALLIGCAGDPLRSAALPARPTLRAPGAAVVLALEGVPAAMADETRAVAAAGGGARESSIPPAEALAAACAAQADRVFRPALSREQFASNVPDRNAFLIYESAVIVGLPVALVSLAAWDWRGETTVDGVLEELRCGDAAPTRYFASFRLETAGNGTMRIATLQEAQRDAAVRALTRKLFALVEATPTARAMENPQ